MSIVQAYTYVVKHTKQISIPWLINEETEVQRYGAQLMVKLEFEIGLFGPTVHVVNCGLMLPYCSAHDG